MKNIKKINKWLILYYGILQSLHLLVLARAGIILLFFQRAPFPILPPPGGWSPESMSFLYGLAGMDVVGIILGIIFVYQYILKDRFVQTLALISLTIFISGAIVFGVGTYPTGAWAAYPVSYGLMVILFIPAIVLYIQLLTRGTSRNR